MLELSFWLRSSVPPGSILIWVISRSGESKFNCSRLWAVWAVLSGFKRGGCSQEGSPYSFAALCLGGGAEREVGPRFVSSHVHSQCLVRSNLVWFGYLPSCRPATGSGITSLVPHTTVLRETENTVLTRIPLVPAHHSKGRLVHFELRLASLFDQTS